MKKNLLMASVILIMLIGLNACCTFVPGKVVYSDKLTDTIENVGAKVAILVTDEGKVLVYNEKGDRENLRECTLPEPTNYTKDSTAAKSSTRQDKSQRTSSDVCKGLTKGSAITSLRTLSILKSNSEDCIIIGKDLEGNPIEICWPSQ